MIVWMCFKSFLPILDFFDFFSPVHTLQTSWKKIQKIQDFSGFWKNVIEVLVVSHQCKGWRWRWGRGGIWKPRKFKIGENGFKHTQTIIEIPLDMYRYRTGPYEWVASRGRAGGANFEVSAANSQPIGTMTTKTMLLIHPIGCIHNISLLVIGPIGWWGRADHVLVNFFSQFWA